MNYSVIRLGMLYEELVKNTRQCCHFGVLTLKLWEIMSRIFQGKISIFIFEVYQLLLYVILKINRLHYLGRFYFIFQKVI